VKHSAVVSLYIFPFTTTVVVVLAAVATVIVITKTTKQNVENVRMSHLQPCGRVDSHSSRMSVTGLLADVYTDMALTAAQTVAVMAACRKPGK